FAQWLSIFNASESMTLLGRILKPPGICCWILRLISSSCCWRIGSICFRLPNCSVLLLARGLLLFLLLRHTLLLLFLLLRRLLLLHVSSWLLCLLKPPLLTGECF